LQLAKLLPAKLCIWIWIIITTDIIAKSWACTVTIVTSVRQSAGFKNMIQKQLNDLVAVSRITLHMRIITVFLSSGLGLKVPQDHLQAVLIWILMAVVFILVTVILVLRSAVLVMVSK